MSLNIGAKKAIVAEVVERLKTAQSVVVAEYRGLQVEALTKLRVRAREKGVYLRVLRNTLVTRAVEGGPFQNLAGEFSGPLIYAISDDPILAAKVLSEFSKENSQLVLRAGSMDGQLLDKVAVVALASIPGREELIAMLLGVMLAPVSGFARVLAAVSEQKQQAEAA